MYVSSSIFLILSVIIAIKINPNIAKNKAYKGLFPMTTAYTTVASPISKANSIKK